MSSKSNRQIATLGRGGRVERDERIETGSLEDGGTNVEADAEGPDSSNPKARKTTKRNMTA